MPLCHIHILYYPLTINACLKTYFVLLRQHPHIEESAHYRYLGPTERQQDGGTALGSKGQHESDTSQHKYIEICCDELKVIFFFSINAFFCVC